MTESSMLKVEIGGGLRLVHRKTNKAIHMVVEVKGTHLETCEYCGGKRKVETLESRPARWYKAKNIVERMVSPTDYYMPIHGE